MAKGFSLEVLGRDGQARAARLTTLHGPVETPTFMPVATFGAVRGISVEDLQAAGAQILLSNTYHLHERPGEQTVEALGGLHGFTGWHGPWLTDSGGYQVTSLAHRAEIDEAGVTFQSALDGQRRQLTPENVIEIQERLGSDIAMVLDECVRVEDKAEGRIDLGLVEAAMQRTLRWLERAQKARQRPEQAVFAIVQGGASEDLRSQSAEATAAFDFEGYAHGGLGLGESREERRQAISIANARLPEDRPRYLMGLGRPVDLLDGVAAGVDLFDCVVPTRNGRHGLLFTSQGTLNLRNAVHKRDARPPDPECTCPACRLHGRGYLRHLIKSGEALGARLASLHNLTYYMNLLTRARIAILEGGFEDLRAEVEAVSERRL